MQITAMAQCGRGRRARQRCETAVALHDVLGRLASVRQAFLPDPEPQDVLTTTYAYTLEGQLARINNPNGVRTDYVYDGLGRLQRMTHWKPGGTQKLAEFVNTFLADGKRETSTETTWDTNQTPQLTTIQWTYDALGRLKSEDFDSFNNTLDFTAAYTFDLASNQLTHAVDQGRNSTIDETTTNVYDANDRLGTETLFAGSTTTLTTYGYDHTQQTSKTVTQGSTTLSDTVFEYDVRGRMVRVEITENSQTVELEYGYDDSGIRISVTSNGQRTEYLVDAQNFTGYQQTILETTFNASDDIVKQIRYVFGHDEITQTVTYFDSEGEITSESTYVFQHDPHASVRALTSLIGALVESYAYDAYGNAVGFNPAQVLTSLQHNGEFRDTAIGLKYLRDRWGDRHRFPTDDEFFGHQRRPWTFNKHAFVHGDPINFNDPTGLVEITGQQLAAIGIATVIGGLYVGGVMTARSYFAHQITRKQIHIFVNPGRAQHFNREKVQTALQQMLDQAKIDATVGVYMTTLKSEQVGVGWTVTTESYLYNSGWWNLNPLDLGVNLLHDILYLPATRERQSFTWHVQFQDVGGFGGFASTGAEGTQVSEPQIDQETNTIQHPWDWDTIYINVFAHEVFWLALCDGVDRSGQGGLKGSVGQSQFIVNITQDEAELIRDALGF